MLTGGGAKGRIPQEIDRSGGENLEMVEELDIFV